MANQPSEIDTLPSTLTPRVAALQIKAWHLLYRMKKIYEDQKALNRKRVPNSPRPKIIRMFPAFYSVIDMIASMEHVSSFLRETRATPEIGKRLSSDQKKTLSRVENVTSKWVSVRHLLGGHIDITNVISACERHNFYGALLSDDLEPDIVVYNLLLLEAALNESGACNNLFGREIDFLKNGIPSELQIIIEKLNEDWKMAFELFPEIIRYIYAIGKAEKLAVVSPEEAKGLLRW